MMLRDIKKTSALQRFIKKKKLFTVSMLCSCVCTVSVYSVLIAVLAVEVGVAEIIGPLQTERAVQGAVSDCFCLI